MKKHTPPLNSAEILPYLGIRNPPQPDDVLDHKLLIDLIQHKLSKLNQKEIKCVCDVIMAGKTLDETGKELGITRETVRQKVARGLRKLQQNNQMGGLNDYNIRKN